MQPLKYLLDVIESQNYFRRLDLFESLHSAIRAGADAIYLVWNSSICVQNPFPPSQ